MNRKLPIEEILESRLNDLPVPNEDAAWQAMSRLLDKEKKPRAILFKRLGMLLLLLVLMLAGYWQWFHQDKPVENTVAAAPGNNQTTKTANNKHHQPVQNQAPVISAASDQNDNVSNSIQDHQNQAQPSANEINLNGQDEDGLVQNNNPNQDLNSKNNNDIPATTGTNNRKLNPSGKDIVTRKSPSPILARNVHKNIYVNRGKVSGQDNPADLQPGKSKKTKRSSQGKARVDILAQAPTSEEINSSTTFRTPQDKHESTNSQQLNSAQAVRQPDTTNTEKTLAIVKQDSARLKTTIAVKAVDSADTRQRKKSHFVWSAGIGLQQQLPVAGKSFNSYGFNGRSNLLHDYIPSVYLSFEKPKRWFVLAELQFGAPRMVDAFTYSRSTSLNYFEGELSTASLQLKKTFYHKASIGFHHYIGKHFSAGVGVDYHWLYRAITESRLSIKQLPDQAETSSSQLLPAGYQDSFLYRSLAGMQVQVNYQWRKFSFGLRYSADLQPFIKYTEPSGDIATRKDHRWEILARYRIWRSGK